MRLLITGASGNVGTALLRRLSGTAHQVLGVSRRDPGKIAPYDAVQWHTVDLAAPNAEELLTVACEGVDTVIHLGWAIQPGRDRQLLRRTNQGGTRAVVHAVRTAGVRHLIHMSSVGAYSPGPQDVPVNEDWPTQGIASSSYSVDKSAAERIVDELAGSTTVLTKVRPSLILQPDAASEIARYFIGPLLPAALIRRPVLRCAPWPAALRLQFVHADDVADALVRIAESGLSGALNLASQPVVDRDLARGIFGGIGPSLPTRLLRAGATLSWLARLQPTEPGWLDLGLGVPLLDTGRAWDELGWRPSLPADEVFSQFLTALSRSQGGQGPLLYPGRRQPLPPGS